MDLSGLESAGTIDTKDFRAAPIYDRLGSFGMVSSPGCSRIVPESQRLSGSPVFINRFIYWSNLGSVIYPCGLSNILTQRQTRLRIVRIYYLSWDEIVAFDTSGYFLGGCKCQLIAPNNSEYVNPKKISS
jgi:hypothetical protein